MSASDSLNFAQFKDKGLANLAKLPHTGNPYSGPGAIHTASVGFKHHAPNTNESLENNIANGKLLSFLNREHRLPDARVEHISLGDIHTTQSTMHGPGIAHYLNKESHPDLPQITRYKGKNWVDDGHHRLGAFMLGGAQTAPAVVREIND